MFIQSNANLFRRVSDTVPRNRRDYSKLCPHGAKTAFMLKSVLIVAPTILLIL